MLLIGHPHVKIWEALQLLENFYYYNFYLHKNLINKNMCTHTYIWVNTEQKGAAESSWDYNEICAHKLSKHNINKIFDKSFFFFLQTTVWKFTFIKTILFLKGLGFLRVWIICINVHVWPESLPKQKTGKLRFHIRQCNHRQYKRRSYCNVTCFSFPLPSSLHKRCVQVANEHVVS